MKLVLCFPISPSKEETLAKLIQRMPCNCQNFKLDCLFKSFTDHKGFAGITSTGCCLESLSDIRLAKHQIENYARRVRNGLTHVVFSMLNRSEQRCIALLFKVLLGLTLSGPAFSIIRQAGRGGSEARMSKIKVSIN